MDSGNSSGSLQSSSGGDEEYDSRAEESSFSAAFMIKNNPSSPQNHGFGLGPFASPRTSATTNNNFANSRTLPPPQQQQQQRHHNNTHMFDPLANYLDPMQRSPPSSLQNSNALLNLDMMWSKPARSEPNPTDLGGLLIPCSSSSQPQQINHALLSAGHQVPGQTTTDSHISGAAFLALPDAQQGQGGSRGLLSVSAANNNDQPHNTNTNTNVVRNPKKRSRASRRAPTTVLTTDTTNFRAMVQEFTGIPAQPFTSSSSPFPRARFDLFGSAAVTTPSSRLLDHSSPVPPYLLRPFPQKLHHHHLHPFPPSSSNSMVHSLLASNNSTNSVTNNSTSINYQLSSASAADHLGLLKHPLNFNMHNNTTTNPILTFQNILQQPPPKYPPRNPSSLASKTQPSLEIPPPCGDSHLKVGVLEELALRGHAHVSTTNVSALHQNTVSGGNASTEWAQRTGTITNDDREHGGGEVGRHGVTVNYSNVAERVTNGKVHYSASSSDFRGEKGTECTVSARSEGMVESWINCSSDN